MTRYLPQALLSRGTDGRHAVSSVIRAEAFPAFTHKGSPIVQHMVAVKATCANGGVRWYGCERAYIDSHLRMVLTGLNERDEVQNNTWEIPAND